MHAWFSILVIHEWLGMDWLMIEENASHNVKKNLLSYNTEETLTKGNLINQILTKT